MATTRKSPKMHDQADRAIETEIRNIERNPKRFNGKTVELVGFPRHVTNHGNKIIFDLVDRPGSTSKKPLIVSVDFDNGKVSVRTFRVAQELLYSAQKINVKGAVSTDGEAVYVAAVALEKLD